MTLALGDVIATIGGVQWVESGVTSPTQSGFAEVIMTSAEEVAVVEIVVRTQSDYRITRSGTTRSFQNPTGTWFVGVPPESRLEVPYWMTAVRLAVLDI